MRKFTFFVGISKPTLTAVWTPENGITPYHNIGVEEELTNLLSAEIARTIDEDIVRRLTQEIIGGLRA